MNIKILNVRMIFAILVTSFALALVITPRPVSAATGDRTEATICTIDGTTDPGTGEVAP